MSEVDPQAPALNNPGASTGTGFRSASMSANCTHTHREAAPAEATVSCSLILLLPVSTLTSLTPSLHPFLLGQPLVFLPHLSPLFALAW